jgi:hypothetical protein
VTATTVTAIADSASAPTITVGTSITTANGTHFVYIANPNSTTAANPETNGLRNLVNTTGAVGGINPSTAGQEFWKAAQRDTSTTVLSLDLLLTLQQNVLQQSGSYFTDVWTSTSSSATSTRCSRTRSATPGIWQMGAGNVEADLEQQQDPGVPGHPRLRPLGHHAPDFVRVHGSIDSAHLAVGRVRQRRGQEFQWAQGATNGVDAIVYPYQVGLQRRNTSAGATALTA